MRSPRTKLALAAASSGARLVPGAVDGFGNRAPGWGTEIEKRRGRWYVPRRSLRRARRILVGCAARTAGSRFSSRRPIGKLCGSPTVQSAWMRKGAAGRCTRSLSRFAPECLGESGPFCPICLGLRGGNALTLQPQYGQRLIACAIGSLPTRQVGRSATLRVLTEINNRGRQRAVIVRPDPTSEDLTRC